MRFESENPIFESDNLKQQIKIERTKIKGEKLASCSLMISQILQIVLNLIFQIGKVVLYHIPNDSIIHLKIFVDNIVSHTSNQFPLCIWMLAFEFISQKISGLSHKSEFCLFLLILLQMAIMSLLTPNQLFALKVLPSRSTYQRT